MHALSIRAVVFDLDGLMFNTEDVFYHAGGELMARRGHSLTEACRDQMLGRRPQEAFAILKAEYGIRETIDQLKTEFDEIFAGLLDSHLAPMPGLEEFLETVEHQGLAKGVATSSPRPYLQKLLSRFAFDDRFHVTLAAEDVSHGKPDPEIYFKAAELLNVPPAQMLVLEDSENGVRSAAAAGAVVVAVPHEHTRHHDFRSATIIVESLQDARLREMLLGVES